MVGIYLPQEIERERKNKKCLQKMKVEKVFLLLLLSPLAFLLYLFPLYNGQKT